VSALGLYFVNVVLFCLPYITTDTDSILIAIIDECNNSLFLEFARGVVYATVIYGIESHSAKYDWFIRTIRKNFDIKLNWNARVLRLGQSLESPNKEEELS